MEQGSRRSGIDNVPSLIDVSHWERVDDIEDIESQWNMEGGEAESRRTMLDSSLQDQDQCDRLMSTSLP